MEKKFQAVYVPVGVGTFHMPSADDQFQQSANLLRELCEDIVVPEDKLLSVDQLSAFLDTVDPDLIILQNLTFAMRHMHRKSCTDSAMFRFCYGHCGSR